MGISQRLRDIEYQILKNLWFEPTDEQRVRMVKRIMYAALRTAQARGEDISSFATAIDRPTEILGVTLGFTVEGDRVGELFSLTRGSVVLNEDLDTPPSIIAGLQPIPIQEEAVVKAEPPVISAIVFSNETPYEYTDIEVTVHATSPGNLQLSYSYEWFINDVSQGTSASNILSGGAPHSSSVYVIASVSDDSGTTTLQSQTITPAQAVELGLG